DKPPLLSLVAYALYSDFVMTACDHSVIAQPKLVRAAATLRVGRSFADARFGIHNVADRLPDWTGTGLHEVKRLADECRCPIAVDMSSGDGREMVGR
ncbi:MAG: hypothetical protein AB7U95_37280, partial [Reyranella sp.]